MPFKKGHKPYYIGGSKIGHKVSYETKKKISESAKRVGVGKWLKGRKRTEEHNKKLGLSRSGSRHCRWKGGITPLRKKLYFSDQYKEWRKSVFERDNYTCKMCGTIGGYLEADHIQPWAYFPKLRFEINNGRTLCKPCHRKTPTFGWNIYNKKIDWSPEKVKELCAPFNDVVE